CQHSWEIPWTF
nr:immunoglobulin light chain junction region [Mus musculus]NSL98963.1 immunoglobulin light chain junction region [Mus musculus]